MSASELATTTTTMVAVRTGSFRVSDQEDQRHDARTGVETGNVDAVLDGELEDFITAQLLGVKNPARALPE